MGAKLEEILKKYVLVLLWLLKAATTVEIGNSIELPWYDISPLRILVYQAVILASMK